MMPIVFENIMWVCKMCETRQELLYEELRCAMVDLIKPPGSFIRSAVQILPIRDDTRTTVRQALGLSYPDIDNFGVSNIRHLFRVLLFHSACVWTRLV